MDNFDSQTSHQPDPDIEALLRDFFRKEMPPELRRSTPVATTVPAVPPAASHRAVANARGPLAPAVGLSVVAATLLLAVTALWSPAVDHPVQPARRNIPKTVSTDTHPPERVNAVDSRAEERLPPMESLVIERYETASGPVEQRTNVRWSNVSVFEPESGREVEVMIPELDIEVFEIDEE